MDSTRKTETITLKSGEKLNIRELNALAQIEMLETQRDLQGRPEAAINMRLAAITCAHCVDEWADSPDEILKERGLEDILEAADKVIGLSGRKKKTSATVTSVGSRSA